MTTEEVDWLHELCPEEATPLAGDSKALLSLRVSIRASLELTALPLQYPCDYILRVSERLKPQSPSQNSPMVDAAEVYKNHFIPV